MCQNENGTKFWFRQISCVARKFQGCFKDVSRVFLRVFRENFKGVSRVFQRSLKGVLGNYQGCFKKASRLLKVFKVLQKDWAFLEGASRVCAFLGYSKKLKGVCIEQQWWLFKGDSMVFNPFSPGVLDPGNYPSINVEPHIFT